MRRRGVAIGEEFRGKGVNIHLGPSVGALGRKPRGGRSMRMPHCSASTADIFASDWEGFGSDPVLQAFGGALTIEGIQSVGVIATIKHLVANEQEMYRMYSLVKPGISSNLDDRTMHELYLWPFAEGVRSGVGSVMIAYNAVSRYNAYAYALPAYSIPTGQWLGLRAEQLFDEWTSQRRAWLPRLCHDRLVGPNLWCSVSIGGTRHVHAR